MPRPCPFFVRLYARPCAGLRSLMCALMCALSCALPGIRVCILLVGVCVLSACCPPPNTMPMQLYVTQGPPLFVIGRMGDTEFTGEMERRALAGFGTITLTAVTAEAHPAPKDNLTGGNPAGGNPAETATAGTGHAAPTARVTPQTTPDGLQLTPGGVPIEPGGVLIAPNEARTVRAGAKEKPGGNKAVQAEGKTAPRETPVTQGEAPVAQGAAPAMQGGVAHPPLQCKGSINNPPTKQGRLHALLPCNDGRFMALSLRNIGPDQGFGLARVIGAEQVEQKKLPPSTPIMPLFYHPGEEEARRRFVDVNREMLQIQKELEQ